MTDDTQPEALRALAEAAKWTGKWYDAGCNTVHCTYDKEDSILHDEIARPVPFGVSGYIAAAHPQAVIALLDRIAELEAQIEALSGVQALSAGPAGWKLVPVNPTPEMWKAAKSVPDPNPPYPPHYGLVWDAMLAASPTPPVEQQAQPGAVYAELHEPDATTVGLGAVWNRHSMRDFADRTHALRMEQAAPKAAPGAAPGDAIDEALRERDEADDFINELLDEVLGADRPEWSSAYNRYDAMSDVRERITALHKPAVDKAWDQFQSAMAAPQQEAQEPAAWQGVHDQTDLYYTKPLQADVRPLYAAPQPAPAELERLRERIARMGLDVDRAMRGHVNEQSPLGTQRLAAIAALVKPKPAPPSDDVVKDAARYRFLAGHCRSTSEHWGGRWSIVVDGPAPKSHDSEDDFDEAVDAAIAAQGGK